MIKIDPANTLLSSGWLVTEPFICPHLYEPYENDEKPAVDEYTLSLKLGKKLNETLTHHYETFIVRPLNQSSAQHSLTASSSD